jgi:hypothetical protein
MEELQEAKIGGFHSGNVTDLTDADIYGGISYSQTIANDNHYNLRTNDLWIGDVLQHRCAMGD